MEKKEKKIKKEIMPEEMLRKYMISKGVDKAVNKKIAWDKAKKEYDGEYNITNANYVRIIYDKTVNELLLGVSSKPSMPEEMLREYMISKGVDKAADKRVAWNKAKGKYSGKYLIVSSSNVKLIYGKTINEILGISKSNMPEEMLR